MSVTTLHIHSYTRRLRVHFVSSVSPGQGAVQLHIRPLRYLGIRRKDKYWVGVFGGKQGLIPFDVVEDASEKKVWSSICNPRTGSRACLHCSGECPLDPQSDACMLF
eukprot:TRINITY_DN12648_c1_g2_i10.p3 TRINITY_DN12648_c1_g2~~TRINITY_DN12648_c1_g2_i10.p3  ORF type:complete len:107 (+),score=3.70 TRINITY_DN12648_c1_g2_i10:75-395(+)